MNAQTVPTVPMPYVVKSASTDSLLVYDIPYAKVAKTDLWRDGVTNCFNIKSYTTEDFPPTTDSITLVMRIYHKKYASGVLPNNNPVMIYLYGGGYLNNRGSLRNIITGSGNPNDQLARYYASQGYITAIVDYRKGWDVLTANPYDAYPMNGIAGWDTCLCEDVNSCKPFTFMEATYRMVQDTRAAHRKLLNFLTQLKIDQNKVYYSGSSTGSIAVLSAAFASDDLPNYYENQTNNTGRKLSDLTSCGPIDKIGLPTPNGVAFSVKGVVVAQAGIRNKDFIEQTDNINILAVAHGQVDDIISRCHGNLMGITFGTRPGKNDLQNIIHLRVYGIRNIYNTYKLLNNCYANFYEFQNVGHALQGDDSNKMKCYVGSPLISCTPLFNPNETQEGQLIVKDVFTPMLSKTISDYYTLGLTNTKIYRNVNNASLCTTCNYVNFVPTCPSQSGLLPNNNYSTPQLREKEVEEISSTKFIYPNPASNTINISLPIIEDMDFVFEANIIDNQGKQIKNISLAEFSDNATISIEDLPKGLYIVQLKTNNVIIATEKFIKN